VVDAGKEAATPVDAMAPTNRPEAGAEAAAPRLDAAWAGADSGPASPELAAACTPATATFMNQNPATGGGKIFNDQVSDPQAFIKQISREVCLVLYDNVAAVKKINQVTLVIESPGSGVAATGGDRTGFSATYIGKLPRRREVRDLRGGRPRVHAHLSIRARPGWMIEGMADFVRFRAGYFKITNRRKGGNYNSAYQTTGFFIAWLDDKYPGFGRRLNAAMRTNASEQTFMDLTGKPVQMLWQEYQAAIP
jgi:hypothetical protein